MGAKGANLGWQSAASTNFSLARSPLEISALVAVPVPQDLPAFCTFSINLSAVCELLLSGGPVPFDALGSIDLIFDCSRRLFSPPAAKVTYGKPCNFFHSVEPCGRCRLLALGVWQV